MTAIKLLILDVDGVLTDGTIWLTTQGEEIKRFHTHDGVGLKRLQNAGVQIAVISGRASQSVSARMAELNITLVFQNCHDKMIVFENLINELNIKPQEVAYIGDDLPDLLVMRRVGLSIAVANACSEVKAIANWHTQKEGGMGAVREACDRLLQTQTKVITV